MARASLVFVLCLAFAGLPVAVGACTTICATAQRSAPAADPTCHKPAPHNAAFGAAPHVCAHGHEGNISSAPAEGLPLRALSSTPVVMMPAVSFAHSPVMSILVVAATSPPDLAAPAALSPLRI